MAKLCFIISSISVAPMRNTETHGLGNNVTGRHFHKQKMSKKKKYTE